MSVLHWTWPCLLGLLVASSAEAAPPTRWARVQQEVRPRISLGDDSHDSVGLAERMKFHRVPGVSVAILDGFELDGLCGVGHLQADGDGLVTENTLFQAASISKPVSAVVALHQVARGHLSLDQEVNERLVHWKVPENNFTAVERVTLRRLLSHTAGLTVHGFAGYAPGAPLPTLLEMLAGRPPANSAAVRVDITPGRQHRYSGGGYLVVEQLLVDVTGQPFADLAAETVLAPLGMTSSTFGPLGEVQAITAAKAHDDVGQRIDVPYHIYPEHAAASLWTTPSDLARFLLGLIQSAHGKSDSVLSMSLAKEMISPQREWTGLGIGVRGVGDSLEIFHGGWNLGYRCEMVAFPELGYGAVVMTNGENGHLLAQEILVGIAVAYDWPSHQPITRRELSIPSELLDEYDGQYVMGELSFRFLRVGERLVLEAPGRGSTFLYASANDTFFMLSENTTITFLRDAEGSVTAAVASVEGTEFRAERVH